MDFKFPLYYVRCVRSTLLLNNNHQFACPIMVIPFFSAKTSQSKSDKTHFEQRNKLIHNPTFPAKHLDLLKKSI